MSDECPYTARQLESVSNGPGRWDYQRIGVFRGDEQVGEFKRNYHAYGVATFAPFERDGAWYALYSPNYTCTRLMSLPDCRDIGGEDPKSSGFCPVECFVPTVVVTKFAPGEVDPAPIMPNWQPHIWADKNILTGVYTWPDDDPKHPRHAEYIAAREKASKEMDAWHDRHPFVTQYAPFGFVAGCMWGDDWSWKIELLDLAEAHNGILKREDRFGHIWLPNGVALRDAIDLDVPDYDNPHDTSKWRITIALPAVFDLSGKRYRDREGETVDAT